MNTLNPKQITNAQKLINDLHAAEYELKQIYGSRWKSESNGRPTSFGKLFKATLEAGKLQNIQLKSPEPRKTNNHLTYVAGR